MKEIFHKRNCLTPDEIKGYLGNSFPKDELHDIEQHLVDCQLCNFAIEGWSMVDQPDKELAKIDNTELPKVKKDVTSQPQEINKKRTIAPLIITAAASLALVIAVIFLLNGKQASPTALFDQYYEAVSMPNPTVRNTESTEIDKMTKSAWQAYSNKDFPASASIFSEILQKERNNSTAMFFGGLSALEMGDFEAAIKILDKLASQSGEQYAEDANWYLALSLLRNHDVERSKEVLRDIINRKGFYSDKANQLATILEDR